MKFSLLTSGDYDIIDITGKVAEKVRAPAVKSGICLISCSCSTCGITTMEYEPNLVADFQEFLRKLIPCDKDYRHNRTWDDANAHSHIGSSLLKPFLTVPIDNGEPTLGSWQQIVFIDFDNRPRRREVLIKIVNSEK